MLESYGTTSGFIKACDRFLNFLNLFYFSPNDTLQKL